MYYIHLHTDHSTFTNIFQIFIHISENYSLSSTYTVLYTCYCTFIHGPEYFYRDIRVLSYTDTLSLYFYTGSERVRPVAMETRYEATQRWSVIVEKLFPEQSDKIRGRNIESSQRHFSSLGEDLQTFRGPKGRFAGLRSRTLLHSCPQQRHRGISSLAPSERIRRSLACGTRTSCQRTRPVKCPSHQRALEITRRRRRRSERKQLLPALLQRTQVNRRSRNNQ